MSNIRTAYESRYPMRKPRFRFGTRTGFVLFTVCCIVTAGIAYRLHLTRAERAAVEQLQSIGGYAAYFGFFDRDWGKLTPMVNALRPFFARVSSVQMPERRPISKDDLALLASFPNLKALSLRFPIQDDDLAILDRISQLHTLSLQGSGITDRGLTHLKSQKKLTTLFLCRTYITAEGLKHLEQLSQLRAIDLEGTLVGDEAIEPLLKIRTLWAVNGLTDVSAAGIEKLRARGLNVPFREPESPPHIRCRVKLPTGRMVMSSDLPFKITVARDNGKMSNSSGELYPSMLWLTLREPGPVVVSATLGNWKSKPVRVDRTPDQKRPVQITLEMQLRPRRGASYGSKPRERSRYLAPCNILQNGDNDPFRLSRKPVGGWTFQLQAGTSTGGQATSGTQQYRPQQTNSSITRSHG